MKKVIKIFVILLLVLGILGVVIYFLLFSPKLANETKIIIPARRAYVDTVNKIVKIDEIKPPIIVLGREVTDPKTYWYSITGTRLLHLKNRYSKARNSPNSMPQSPCLGSPKEPALNTRRNNNRL